MHNFYSKTFENDELESHRSYIVDRGELLNARMYTSVYSTNSVGHAVASDCTIIVRALVRWIFRSDHVSSKKLCIKFPSIDCIPSKFIFINGGPKAISSLPCGYDTRTTP